MVKRPWTCSNLALTLFNEGLLFQIDYISCSTIFFSISTEQWGNERIGFYNVSYTQKHGTQEWGCVMVEK
jgi:hypothetical protein